MHMRARARARVRMYVDPATAKHVYTIMWWGAMSQTIEGFELWPKASATFNGH